MFHIALEVHLGFLAIGWNERATRPEDPWAYTRSNRANRAAFTRASRPSGMTITRSPLYLTDLAACRVFLEVAFEFLFVLFALQREHQVPTHSPFRGHPFFHRERLLSLDTRIAIGAVSQLISRFEGRC